MNKAQRDIRRKKRVVECAARSDFSCLYSGRTVDSYTKVSMDGQPDRCYARSRFDNRSEAVLEHENAL